MATVKEIIQKIIQQTTADPPLIRWNRKICGTNDTVDNVYINCDPKTSGAGWFSHVQLDQTQVLDETFVAKVYVAGQHVNTITDDSTNDIVSTTDSSLDLSIIDTTAPFKVVSATLNKTTGALEIKWNGYREKHQIAVSYEYIKSDCDPGDFGVTYYTGDTPFDPKPEYDWGISIAYTKKHDKSQLKSKKLLLYSNRLPYYALEPIAGSTDEENINNLFKTIELSYLDAFKYFLNNQSAPDDSLTGDEILT
jgi:hypothetical protein